MNPQGYCQTLHVLQLDVFNASVYYKEIHLFVAQSEGHVGYETEKETALHTAEERVIAMSRVAFCTVTTAPLSFVLISLLSFISCGQLEQ